MTGRSWITILLVSVGIVATSCGDRERLGGSAGPGDTVRPHVVSANISEGATDVGLAVPIAVTFSEAMDPASITPSSVAVAGASTRGRVEYNASTLTATLTLDTLFAAGATVTVFVNAGATDLAGNGTEPFERTFRTGPFDCAHIADRLEPNNDEAASSPVEVGKTTHLLTACGDDRDVYRFTLSEARKITVKTPILETPSDSSGYPSWQIYFTREDGDDYATLGTSASPEVTPSYSYSFLPGTYYVEIYPYHEMEQGQYILYDLDVSSSEPCADDAYEDNDFPDTAAALALGLHTGLRGCRVDQDCYMVPMSAGQTLVLIVDAPIAGGSWGHRRINLHAPDGASDRYEGEENPDTLQVISDTAGNAQIDIRFWTDDVTYSMDLHYAR
jgi:hypothetical protein